VRDFKRYTTILLSLGFCTLAPIAAFSQVDEEFQDKKEQQKQEVIERELGQYEFDPEAITKSGRLKKLGKRAFKIEDYYTTIEYLTPYMERKPEDWKRAWMIAESYRKTRDYKSAEDWYTKISANKKDKYPKSLFYQATMQKSNGFFDEVETLMNDFKKEYKKGDDVKEFKKRLRSETEGAIAARSIIDSALKVVVTPLSKSVNRETMESSPIIVNNDKLIFGSIDADIKEFYSLVGPERPERKLYVAEKVGNEWKRTEELSGPFNDPEFNVSSGSFSPDGLRFYFSKCPKKITSKNKCAIYMSEFRDNEWGTPEKLPDPINIIKANSTMPSVGYVADRKTGENVDVLYFVSDREKSRGGFDIWYSIFDARKGVFRKVKNAGSKLNSAGDDITPNYDSEVGELYFSSNGHPNIGGFDIFKSQGNPNDKFSEVENIGYPLNSTADDIFFTVSKEQDHGYLVSNRLGSNSTINPNCCDDIFKFIYSEFLKIGVQGIVYEINDENKEYTGNNQVENVTVSLVTRGKSGDTTLLKELIVQGYDPYFFTLQHGKQYLIKVEKKNYETRYLPISTMTLTEADTLTEKIGLKKMPAKELYIPIVNFDMNRASISRGQKQELSETVVKLMAENPDLRLRVVGHTDDIGTDKYNVKLSEKRAKNVYEYLVEKGVDASRLNYEGKGMSVPIMIASSDSEIEFARTQNRRVEFYLDGDGNFLIQNEKDLFKENE